MGDRSYTGYNNTGGGEREDAVQIDGISILNVFHPLYDHDMLVEKGEHLQPRCSTERPRRPRQFPPWTSQNLREPLIPTTESTTAPAVATAASVVRRRAPVSVIGALHCTITRVLLSVAIPKVTIAVTTPHLVVISSLVVSPISPVSSTTTTVVTPAIAVAVSVTAAVAASVAATTSSSAAIALHTPSSTSSAATGGHLLLGQSFLHLHLVPIDNVVLCQHRFSGGVGVLEEDKAEAPLPAGLFVRDDLGLLHHAELGEVLGQVVRLDVVFHTADKNFLNVGEDVRVISILSCYGPFQFHIVAFDDMWLSRHCSVGLLRRRVGDKAETAGPAELLVHDHNAVVKRAKLLKILADAIFCGLHVEASYKKLAQFGGHD
ncbi:hypothetical protein FQN60_010007 [Etheostoma spectabile]|uniref:Uncharacterized protein n=1 Tax=Etheostoma spectabile TaxID=54343 RepID=A0A5J5D1T9_9PERO|nr:hypothetical protein FQN60_010007 [Etheostoma spectabile]